ncbi:MAG TPA: N-acetylmuramoyl-L-alanine amidase [Steroidobacteraceae bacterium]
MTDRLGLYARGGLSATALALAWAALGSPAAADATELQQLALQSDSQSAVLTLTLSGPVAPHLFRLSGPERLVIDLPSTHRQARLPKPSSNGVITMLRSGVRAGQELRLVLELRSALEPQMQALTRANHYQLRIALGATPEGAGPAAITAEAPAAVPADSPAATATTATLTPSTPAQAPARPTRAVRVAHAPLSGHSIIVAVDAGHGGDDPGATGLTGTHEKVVTLAIARALAARIDREPGMHAVLTRDGDYFVALRGRMDRAQSAHANLFVSIHADAVRDRGVSGASVYILSERGASSEAARTLAEQQNAVDLKSAGWLTAQRADVRSVVLDAQQNANMGQSVEVADRVLGALDRVGAVRKREVQQAAFVVLKSPFMPSLLVETAYISNVGEERKLRTPAEQQRLAEAIFGGIVSYFRKFPPDGTEYARSHEGGTEPDVELARSGF